jgi:alkylated DNA repair dioxygenase AlkB
MLTGENSVFGATVPGVVEPYLRDLAPERTWLDGSSWVDVVRGWVVDGDSLYDGLAQSVPWRASRLWRYDRWIEEPRVGAAYAPGRGYPHRVLLDAHRAIRRHYGVELDGMALAWYRDGRDSVAFHRDRELRFCEDTVIAILTLGATRPWLLRPRARHDKWIAERQGAVVDLRPAHGDLVVMGGRCQADWEHSVPKVDRRDAGRISAQWRWTSRRGRPEVGGSYRAPRHYART